MPAQRHAPQRGGLHANLFVQALRNDDSMSQQMEASGIQVSMNRRFVTSACPASALAKADHWSFWPNGLVCQVRTSIFYGKSSFGPDPFYPCFLEGNSGDSAAVKPRLTTREVNHKNRENHKKTVILGLRCLNQKP